MPTTFANTIDGNDIYAKRAECDAAGNDLSTTYATKSEIPGSSQLVPSATVSDANKVLTVDSNGTPGWAASQGLFVAQYGTTTYSQVVAAIEAKKIVYCRISADWNDSRMAFLAYDAHTSVNGNVEFQYIRSNSNSSGTDSIFVYKLYRNNTWETTERTVKAGNISYPVTTVNVNGSSAMTGTVANITVQEVPAVTSSDNNKVLKASYSGGTGSYSWQTESGGGGGGDGADWAAEEGEPGYIENKPVPKTLTAGSNITISEGVSTLTISAAAGLPASTSADEGKCLVVDSNGDPEWGTGGKTYTGTDGVVVDNVNDTVGLEAPVDIVAGPGIAIDNPDGNTVRISYSGYNETLLWSSSTAASSFTLSEIITNFERLKILMQCNGMKSWCDGTIVSAAQFTVACCGYANNSGDGNRLQIFGGSFTSSNGKSFSSEAGKCIYFSNGNASIGGGTTAACTFLKIYGVNRIAND